MLVVTACEENDYEFGPITAPTGLSVDANIIGQDDLNPYGNGDGLVAFTATADNALAYQFDFGDGNVIDVLDESALSAQKILLENHPNLILFVVHVLVEQ